MGGCQEHPSTRAPEHRSTGAPVQGRNDIVAAEPDNLGGEEMATEQWFVGVDWATELLPASAGFHNPPTSISAARHAMMPE